jgi:hypothetical protein
MADQPAPPPPPAPGPSGPMTADKAAVLVRKVIYR